MTETKYLPIEDYGIIGNMRSAALVSVQGSIDWFCYPHFDSPSVFARLLDHDKGGYFSIFPESDYHTKQLYWPDTNVLITRYLSDDGIVEVSDFMPVGPQLKDSSDYRIIRSVKGIHGEVKMVMECLPAFDYGRDGHELKITGKLASFRSKDLNLNLSSSIPLSSSENKAAASFTLKQDESVVFVLHNSDRESKINGSLTTREVENDLHQTILYWRNWISRSTYKGRWREMVHRSALILKLLTFEPTGAIVASITTSLPESIGGDRNWDYRYTWIRDAAFTVYAFLRIGFTQEAEAFMDWVIERCSHCSESGALQIMYGIDGRSELKEESLTHLEGYRGSSPVRIGNGAYNQLQLDIYGELMDSVYLFNK